MSGRRRWALAVVVGLLWGLVFPLWNALSGRASLAHALVEGLVLGPIWFLAFTRLGARASGTRGG